MAIFAEFGHFLLSNIPNLEPLFFLISTPNEIKTLTFLVNFQPKTTLFDHFLDVFVQ